VTPPRASSFCPGRFYGAAVSFVEEEKRSERNEHGYSANGSERISAGITYLYESIKPAHWPANEIAESAVNKTEIFYLKNIVSYAVA
jgi:hypothetical protein